MDERTTANKTRLRLLGIVTAFELLSGQGECNGSGSQSRDVDDDVELYTNGFHLLNSLFAPVSHSYQARLSTST